MSNPFLGATQRSKLKYQGTVNENTLESTPADGQLELGNIDLHSRPIVKNADGSISTVRSMSFGEDGVEVLIPTVGDEGVILDDDTAIERYRKTGKHLGKFKTPEAATSYANSLHDAQDKEYNKKPANPFIGATKRRKGAATSEEFPVSADNPPDAEEFTRERKVINGKPYVLHSETGAIFDETPDENGRLNVVVDPAILQEFGKSKPTKRAQRQFDGQEGKGTVITGRGDGMIPSRKDDFPEAEDGKDASRLINAQEDELPDGVSGAPGSGGDDGPQTPQIARKTDKGGADPFLYSGGKNPHSPFMQGATLGAQDELMSAALAPIEMGVNALTGEGPTNPKEAYAQVNAKLARDKALYEEENPKKAIAAEIAGGVMTGAGGAKFIAKAPSIIGKALRSGVVGGGIGGAQGFLDTEGDLEERAEGAAVGATIGGVLGGILPPVFAGSRALLRGLTAPMRSLANKETFAAGKVAEALGRDKLTPERVAKRLAANSTRKSDLAVADVAGSNTGNLLRAAANVPSDARQGMIRQLEVRQVNQLKRLQEDIGGAFGDPQQFHKTVESIVASRKAAAKPLFDQAFNTPTPFTVTLESVLKRPLTGQLVERARIAAANRGEKFKNIFIQQNAQGQVSAKRVIDTEGLHRVKMTVDEMINGLKRGEETGLKNVNMRDLTILKKDLLAAIDNQPYKAALARYSGDSAMVNALDDGFENGLKMDPETIRTTLAALSPSERRLWRLGFSRSISDSLRDTGRTGANRADVLAAPKYIQRLDAAITDKNARRDLMQAIQLEQRMARTRNIVQGNSTTAKQLAEGQEAAIDAQDAKDMLTTLKQAGTGNFIQAAISFIGRAKNTMTGLRPEVADEIIRLLTAKTPSAMKRANQLINNQARVLARKKGRVELLDGLRAVSSGLLGGQVGQAVANP